MLRQLYKGIILGCCSLLLVACNSKPKDGVAAPPKEDKNLLVGLWETTSGNRDYQFYCKEDGSYKWLEKTFFENILMHKFGHSGQWKNTDKALTLSIDNSQETFWADKDQDEEWTILENTEEYLILNKDGQEYTLKHLVLDSLASFNRAYEESAKLAKEHRFNRQKKGDNKLDKTAKIYRNLPETTCKAFLISLNQNKFGLAKNYATFNTGEVLEYIKNIYPDKEPRPYTHNKITCQLSQKTKAYCSACCDAEGQPKDNIILVLEADGWAVDMKKEEFKKEETSTN